MTAEVIDGDRAAEKIHQELAAEVEQLKALGKTPHLVAVQVGGNPASKIYVKNQQKSCEAIGIKYTLKQLPDGTDEAGLIHQISMLNNDLTVSAIILQMPLPPAINARKIQALINPVKDVEGISDVCSSDLAIRGLAHAQRSGRSNCSNRSTCRSRGRTRS